MMTLCGPSQSGKSHNKTDNKKPQDFNRTTNRQTNIPLLCGQLRQHQTIHS
jgi:hypothetical protein